MVGGKPGLRGPRLGLPPLSSTWKSKQHRVLKSAAASITRIAWRPDDGRLAAGAFDGSIVAWNPWDDLPPQPMRGHVSMVTGLAWSPDGHHVYACSLDQTVRGWTADNGNPLWTVLIGNRDLDFRFDQHGQPVNHPTEAENHLVCVAEERNGPRRLCSYHQFQHFLAGDRFNLPLLNGESAAKRQIDLDAVKWEVNFPHKPNEIMTTGSVQPTRDSIILNAGSTLRRYVAVWRRNELELDLTWPDATQGNEPQEVEVVFHMNVIQGHRCRVAVVLRRERFEDGKWARFGSPVHNQKRRQPPTRRLAPRLYGVAQRRTTHVETFQECSTAQWHLPIQIRDRWVACQVRRSNVRASGDCLGNARRQS